MKTSLQHVVKVKRGAIAKRAGKALSNYKKGAIKKGNIKDLYKDFENG
jgi:hypothetical protein